MTIGFFQTTGFYAETPETTHDEIRRVTQLIHERAGKDAESILLMLGLTSPINPIYPPPIDLTEGGLLCSVGRHENVPANWYRSPSRTTMRCLLCKQEMNRANKASLKTRKDMQ